jgi:hypothetical protein
MYSNTAAQTKHYDRGYEDAIEDRKPRSSDEYYLKGYRAGMEYMSDYYNAETSKS